MDIKKLYEKQSKTKQKDDDIDFWKSFFDKQIDVNSFYKALRKRNGFYLTNHSYSEEFDEVTGSLGFLGERIKFYFAKEEDLYNKSTQEIIEIANDEKRQTIQMCFLLACVAGVDMSTLKSRYKKQFYNTVTFCAAYTTLEKFGIKYSDIALGLVRTKNILLGQDVENHLRRGMYMSVLYDKLKASIPESDQRHLMSLEEFALDLHKRTNGNGSFWKNLLQKMHIQ